MTRSQLGALALALTLTLGACGDSTESQGPGTFSVLLTDAPGDFLQAVVEIERVEMVGQDGAVVLRDTPFVTDLLDLSNTVADLVDQAPVPPGFYPELNFVIPGACIEVEGENGTSEIFASDGFTACGAADGPLRLPTSNSARVNLPSGATSVVDALYFILVDFSVAQSFEEEAGGSGAWVLDPVLRAEQFISTSTLLIELIELPTAGLAAVGGSLGDFRARIDATPRPVPFVDPDGDGVWTASFQFQIPGRVEVSLELRDGANYQFTTDPASPVSVELGPGAGSITSFTVTSASN